MLIYIKRFRDYETIGGIFSSIKQYILEYNMAERIWILLCEIIKSSANLFEIPLNNIMRKLFENQKFEKTIFKLINDDYMETNIIDNAL